ncbi:peptidase M16 [Chromatiales bacterium (ex Bugula neritina AB1)]|nr:peptidase M16 [Chromatiales bacterium (ex Bugula neritina AB1)]
MPQSAVFEELRRYPIASLNMEFQEYRHKKTGARHMHLAADDDQNAFLVAFLTVPQDSTGVAHILEHTALCGSKRYPVRDPFFMMLRRSLNTFMNAFTASDWTAYPFASRNRKDFYNLLDVYLDAAFFPSLNELDFRQEGHRLDFTESGNINSPLMYKGVVFNEMKGAYSSPNARLMKQFSTALFPSITYHHDSGGDPAVIPDLSWEQLKAFHSKHYHPSNAVMFTYGDLPASELQDKFEERALNEFEALDVSGFAIPDEQRYTSPQNMTASYPLAEESTEGKTHVALGWLLGKNSDMRKVMEARVLSDVLLDNSSSPLRRALETSDLGSSPSPLCGADDDTREMTFAAGLEGTDPEKADAVEALIMVVLEDIATNGVPTESVMSVLHQLELAQREVTGDGFPYGLQLAMRALTPALHGGDPVAALDIDNLLDDLRKDAEDPQFIPRLVQDLLLDNPHRIRLVMSPDCDLAAAEEAAEAENLKALDESLNEQQRARIAELAADLEERQSGEDDAELLPRVTLEDVPAELKFPVGESRQTGDMPGVWYTTGTNGMVYQQLVSELPAFDDSLLDVLPIYTMCLTEVGSAGRNYLDTQAQQAAVLGGLGARISTRSVLGKKDDMHASMVISAKGLNRNYQHISRMIHETLDSPDFTETSRIKDLISQTRARRESSITGRGHGLAMTAATSQLSATGALSHRWGGLQGIAELRALDERLQKNPAEVAALSEKLNLIHERICNAPREWLVVSEQEQHALVAQEIARCGITQRESASPGFAIDYVSAQVKQAWCTNAQVNYCAQAKSVVASGHPAAPVFTVLSEYLGNGFLHSAVREKGGAYGGGASYDGEGGAFRFYSYRDPRLQETFDDFDASITWLLNEKHEERLLEEAILGVIGRIDKPGSPAGEAVGNYYAERYGRGADYIQQVRQNVLKVTLADLKNVAEEYLVGGESSYAVVGGADKLSSLAGFDRYSV